MTSGFTDDAGDPAINDDVPDDGGAVGDAIDGDALVGDVIDPHSGDGDAIDGDTAHGDAADDDAADDDAVDDDAVDDDAVDDDAADDDAADDDVVVDRDGSGNAAQAADVNVGDEAPVEGDEAYIDEADGPGVRASLEA